jgi:hypothetical protein
MTERLDETTARRRLVRERDVDPGRSPRRARRDHVTWVALGLLVVVALAVVSRASTDDPRTHDGASAHHRHDRADLVSNDDPATTTSASTPAPLGRKFATSKSPAHDPTTSTSTTTSTTTTTTTTTTSTTAAPATTTTTTPAPQRSTAGSLQYHGTLSYPSDVATSIPFVSRTGLAAARATWSNGEDLTASLRCRGASESAPGRHGISISVDGAPGTCVVSIALANGARGSVSYTIAVLVPEVGP